MRLFVLGSFVQACCWSIGRLPVAGETFLASNIHIEAGGKGLNVAICARRLGAEVNIALGIGEDDAADSVLKLLQLEQVDVQHCHRLSKQSGYGAGLISACGQNTIAVYPGPNLLLTADHLTSAFADIAASQLVYGQFETSLDAIEQAFIIAKQHQILTVLNPSPWQNFTKNLLAMTDILIVNEVEAAQLFNIPLTEISLKLKQTTVLAVERLAQLAKQFYLNWHGCCLCVTLVEFGSVAFLPDGKVEYVAAYSINAVDSVGAGDAFASGFCVAYLLQKRIAEALQYGNACGAIVASKSGVLDALPCTQKVADFLF